MGAGILLSGYSQYQQGQARANELQMQRYQSLYNARIAEADAAAAARKADFEQMQHLRESEAVMGSMRAVQGASGARTDVGTNFLIRLQQSAESELDNFLIGLEGRTEAGKYKSEAEMHKIQASYFGKAAKSARRAGKLGAVTAILGGFGTMGAMGMFGGGSTNTSAGGASYWGAGQRRAASLAGP